MTDIAITSTSVLKGSGASTEIGTAGAAITAGQLLYKDTSADTWKLADANSGTAAARSPGGIALNGAASGQPLLVLTGGNITIGGTVVPGTFYIASATSGGIAPAADATTGWYPALVGVGISATVIKVRFGVEAGVAL